MIRIYIETDGAQALSLSFLVGIAYIPSIHKPASEPDTVCVYVLKKSD